MTYLSGEDLKRLDAIAAKRDSSRSSVARELLRAALTASARPDKAAS
jgi:predicted transcriptional regulator